MVDWAGVKNFGDANTHSFETWIQLAQGAAGTGASSEQITFTYGTSTGAGDPDSGSNWGAENRTGSSGVNLASQPANNSEFAVHDHAAGCRWSGDDQLRHLLEEGRLVSLGGVDDVGYDARCHGGLSGGDGHAVTEAPATGRFEGPPPGGPSAFSPPWRRLHG